MKSKKLTLTVLFRLLMRLALVLCEHDFLYCQQTIGYPTRYRNRLSRCAREVTSSSRKIAETMFFTVPNAKLHSVAIA
jgi:hypothetical protein